MSCGPPVRTSARYCRKKRTRTSRAAGDIIDRLIASFGSMLLYWFHYSQNGRRIDVETDDDTMAGHFLHLLHGKKPSGLHERPLTNP